MTLLTMRPDARGTWWALNRLDRGWASFGYPFAYLGDALDAFRARAVSFGTDAHGLYVLAERVDV